MGGWGPSRPAPANEVYPAHYPRLTKAEVALREAALQKTDPSWRVTLGYGGFLEEAARPATREDKLSSDEVTAAQRFIDAHFELYGLARPTPLARWHDGLYYISPVDDPRYGVAVQSRTQRVVIAGHLWPGFTMRSSARKDPRELLRPWLGRRMRIDPQPGTFGHCDPVNSVNDCPSPPQSSFVTVGLDNASYVVHARLTATDIEVRELLVLPLASGAVLLEPEKGPLPSALDARTGEEVTVTALGPGMSEEGGAALWWGWYQDESHLDFNVRFDTPQP
jgi:hypothetical protein